MNFVYIYGPPGVGKLTVARELAELTGYKLFHNHLSIDCVRPVFEFGSPPFWRLVFAIRLAVIEEAARQGVSLVYTSVFNASGEPFNDMEIAGARFDAVERHGGKPCLVKLSCSVDELERRVQTEQRVEMNKLTSVDQLRIDLARRSLLEAIPGRESLSIDNSQLSPATVAARIAEHYGL